MCGRYIRTSPAEALATEFGIISSAPFDLRPRYNVCPGEIVAAVVSRGGERRLGGLRWGFELPARAGADSPRTVINVRSETAATRGAFAEALRRRRCLIVADGFYEWRRIGARDKVPYFLRLRSARPFALAGLWQRPMGEGRPPSAAILTCAPTPLVAAIHDRMPVILDREMAARWLDPRLDDPGMLMPLFQPLPDEALEAYPVSSLVNSPRNDSPKLIDRISLP